MAVTFRPFLLASPVRPRIIRDSSIRPNVPLPNVPLVSANREPLKGVVRIFSFPRPIDLKGLQFLLRFLGWRIGREHEEDGHYLLSTINVLLNEASRRVTSVARPAASMIAFIDSWVGSFDFVSIANTSACPAMMVRILLSS